MHYFFQTATVNGGDPRLGGETITTPLNIDQALDARDAIAKALYTSLFTWMVARLNKICSPSNKPGGGRGKPGKAYKSSQHRNIISMVDLFGFEDFPDNSFEQLCINFANEALQAQFNRLVFKLEQAEYAREKVEWTPIPYSDNSAVVSMINKKPVGIFHLLDDESNFPKASDLSFLEKCHYNHALNELYSRPRMASTEFGIRHYAGQVWYSVEGFLEKNRDAVNYEVMGLMISSRDKMISKMFLDLRNLQEASKTTMVPPGYHSPASRATYGGHLVTMKPRAPTVAARFSDSLNQLLATLNSCPHPFYIRCLKPNGDKTPMKFDMPVVLEQLRYTGMLETIRIRKAGFPARMKYLQFVRRYRCLLHGRDPRGAPTKEVARVILDSMQPSLRARKESRRELYALGAHKVFLRESLEKHLEAEREVIMAVEVVKIQRQVRGYLARKRYVAMKNNATTIQSAFRGYRVRREYSKLRRGMVQLQAQYRMRKQQNLYSEMKTELQRRSELEADLRLKRAAEMENHVAMTDISEEVGGGVGTDTDVETRKARGVSASPGLANRNRSVASVNHLEVPAELAFVMSKLDKWCPINSEKNLSKVAGEVASPSRKKERLRLPHDIDYYVFSKVANVYFKSHLWQMKREPIKTPFLSKSKESDYQESLAIFKLILRFMNDNNLGGMREKVLADYIVNKGLQNEKLRDEIFCQLANQTWKNENDENRERGWLLMASCLSAFPPSKMLYKYLLKYVSDHGHDGYKSLCQRKLLKAGKLDHHTSRQFPPTMLEWRANKKRVGMALEAKCADGFTRHAQVESMTTAEEFAGYILSDKGVPETSGWTVCLDEGDASIELNGGDFVLDAIGEMELPPSFPAPASASSGHFLLTRDRSRGQLPLLINTGPHNNPQYRYERARSQDRLATEDFGLSHSSALNERYFGEKEGSRKGKTDGKDKDGNKSRSLDNLLGQDNAFGLSESRLNQRYRGGGDGGGGGQTELSPEDLEMESISQRGGRRERWDDVGLEQQRGRSKGSDRYFSQPDLMDKASPANNKSPSHQNGGGKARSQTNMTRLEDVDYPANPDGAPSKVGRSRLHGHPKHVKGQFRKGEKYNRSSAMSDTSEAPSIASHVRRVRVPSQVRVSTQKN